MSILLMAVLSVVWLKLVNISVPSEKSKRGVCMWSLLNGGIERRLKWRLQKKWHSFIFNGEQEGGVVPLRTSSFC